MGDRCSATRKLDVVIPNAKPPNHHIEHRTYHCELEADHECAHISRDLMWGRFLTDEESRTANLLTLEALARDEHDQRCGCTGEACKLGEVLRVLDGGETEPAESSDEGNRVPEYMREDFNAMVAQMRDPEAGACSCGFPKKPCLRIMLRNGPPFPARPCEPV